MKYVKIPTKTFKMEEMAKLENTYKDSMEEGQGWKAGTIDSEDYKPMDTYEYIPLDYLRGCSFTPTSFLHEVNEAFETGDFNRTLITCMSGDSYATSWSVKEFVEMMISWGLMDSGFIKEV